jgi:hypothetical protein
MTDPTPERSISPGRPSATAGRVVALAERAAALTGAELLALAAQAAAQRDGLEHLAIEVGRQHALWLNHWAMFNDWETPGEEAALVASRVAGGASGEEAGQLTALAAGWAAISIGVANFSCDPQDLARLAEPWARAIGKVG